MAGLQHEFKERNCKILGLSVDTVADHHGWEKDIEETQGDAVALHRFTPAPAANDA